VHIRPTTARGCQPKSSGQRRIDAVRGLASHTAARRRQQRQRQRQPSRKTATWSDRTDADGVADREITVHGVVEAGGGNNNAAAGTAPTGAPPAPRLPSTTPQYTLLGRKRHHSSSRWCLSCLQTSPTTDYSTYGDAITSSSASSWSCPLRRGGPASCRMLCDPGHVVNNFFHWTFRTSFPLLLLAFIVMFFIATFVFAGLILWSAAGRPKCIASSAFGSLFTDASRREHLADAYALSWTTFSTVGYGLVYPQVSTVYEEQRRCAGVKMVCSLEAFLGVLFSGLCGAVLFAKVNRVQAHAQVMFTDPMVVRYGSGIAPDMHDESTVGGDGSVVMMVGDGDGGDDNDGNRGGSLKDGRREGIDFGNAVAGIPPTSSAEQTNRWPCPVLEFRIINKLAHTLGGEIMDATLQCSASIDEAHACPFVRNAVRARHGRSRNKRNKVRDKGGGHRHKKDKEKKARHTRNGTFDSSLYAEGGPELHTGRDQSGEVSGLTRASTAMSTTSSDTGSDSEADDDVALLNPSLVETAKQHQEVVEDTCSGGGLVPRRIFSKIHVQPDTHPFFKRVWLVRHVLDETSPLLTKEAQALVQANDGFWPDVLNNHEAVRKSIAFNTILVSLSGTCNTNASTVFAHKTYDFVDVCIGYQFANVLYRDRTTGALKVDKNILNDVREQYGGGGEPFENIKDKADASSAFDVSEGHESC